MRRSTYVLLRQVVDDNVSAPSPVWVSEQSKCCCVVDFVRRTTNTIQYDQSTCSKCNRRFSDALVQVSPWM